MKASALVINKYSTSAAIVRLLTAAGYRVDTAAGLAEGLPKLERRQYSVIVCIETPGDESWQTCEKLRRVTGAPVIVISPRAGADACVRAIHAGADFFLRNPFGPLEFLARVAALRQRSRFPHTALLGV